MLSIVTEAMGPTECGACPAPLPDFQVWRGVAFDDFHELPPEIRSGAVNYLPCQACGYQASLWPGFICVDRRRGRTIFVCHTHDDAGNEARFTETVALLRDDAGFAGIDWERPYIEATNYRDVQSLLTHDDELFALEADYWRAFARRRDITDVRARAVRLLNDTADVGIIMLSGAEAAPGFRAALFKAATQRLEAPSSSERDRRVAQIWLDLEARTQRLRGVPIDDVREPSADDEAEDAFIEAARAAGGLQANVSLPPEVRRVAKALVEALENSLRLSPEPVAFHRLALRRLCAIEDIARAFVGGDPKRGDPARLPALREKIEAAAVSLGEWPLRAADGADMTLRDLAERAAAGVRTHQVLMGNVAADYVRRGELSLDRAGTAIELLTSIAEQHGDLEALISAAFVIVQCEEREGLDDVVIYGTLAQMLLAMDDSRRGRSGLMLERSSAMQLGVAAQRLAAYFAKLTMSYPAGLCSALSAGYFGLVGRADGVFAGRTDAAQHLHNAGRLSDHVLRDLIDDLKADPSAGLSARRDLARALVMRAQKEFAAISAPAANLQMGFRDGLEEAVMIAADQVLFGRRLPGDGDAEPQADLPFGPGFDPELVRAIEAQAAAEDEAPGERTIVITGVVQRQDAPPHVALASIAARWYATLGEALGIADELQDGELVLGIYSFFFAHLRSFAEPHWVLYFVRVVRSELLRRKIAPEPGPQLVFASAELGAALAMRDAFADRDRAEALAQGPATRFVTALQHFESPAELARSTDIEPVGALVEVGELLEAMGHFAPAAAYFAEAARFTLANNEVGHQQVYRAQSYRAAVLPVYRAARALAKSDLTTGEGRFMSFTVELMEYVRAHSQRLAPGLKPWTDEASDSANPLNAALEGLPVRLGGLGEVCPPDSAVVTFSLAHSTDRNFGFWHCALILPGTSELAARYVPFHEIFEPFKVVAALVEKAQGSIVGRRLEDLDAALDADRAEFDTALETLADALLPEDVMSLLQSRGVSRLYIVPESYLHHVPWAALLVRTGTGRAPLCDVGPEGLRINLLPSLAVLAKRPRLQVRHRAEAEGPAALLALDVRWRHDVAPIYGVRKRLVAALTARAGDEEEPSSRGDLDLERPEVVSFVNMVRDHPLSLFFGHGEVGDDGAQLILEDGLVTERVVEGATNVVQLAGEVALLMACSGVSTESPAIGREVPGVHMALVRGGVGCVVGSDTPMTPIVALWLVEQVLPLLVDGASPDVALEVARRRIRSSQGLGHPLFWGHLVCFGDGSRPLSRTAQGGAST